VHWRDGFLDFVDRRSEAILQPITQGRQHGSILLQTAGHRIDHVTGLLHLAARGLNERIHTTDCGIDDLRARLDSREHFQRGIRQGAAQPPGAEDAADAEQDHQCGHDQDQAPT
jgi:hypothetical protein